MSGRGPGSLCSFTLPNSSLQRLQLYNITLRHIWLPVHQSVHQSVLSVFLPPLKCKLHTGRTSTWFTLWHIIQVWKKRCWANTGNSIHMPFQIDSAFPTASLPLNPFSFQSCSSAVPTRGTLWLHFRGTFSLRRDPSLHPAICTVPEQFLARVLAPPSEERGLRQDRSSFCLPGSYGKNMSLLNSSPVSSLDQFDGPLI